MTKIVSCLDTLINSFAKIFIDNQHLGTTFSYGFVIQLEPCKRKRVVMRFNLNDTKKRTKNFLRTKLNGEWTQPSSDHYLSKGSLISSHQIGQLMQILTSDWLIRTNLASLLVRLVRSAV